MTTIEIVEVSPRDGLQNELTLLGTADKVELIRRAVRAGAGRLEATSFVDPRKVPQMADADSVMEETANLSARRIGLVLNERGFARAVAAGCEEVTVVVVASETFSRRNQGAGVAETLVLWRRIARDAAAAGLPATVMIAAAFGCPFEGEVAPERVDALVAECLEGEPAELGFADTIGCGVPTQVERLLGDARRRAPGMRLRCHFHDTRGTGLANAAAAVGAGASALDASIGGFGGCPFAPGATGNIATEDLAWMLGRMGVTTGIDLPATLETASWLGDKLGRPPASAISRAGPFPA